MTYKFRAECVIDIKGLKPMVFKSIVQDRRLPDVECVVEFDGTLEELRDVLRGVPNGHVMVQTVALLEQYTGERDYEIP